MNINIGDSVIVKKGIKDPDFDSNIEVWQGRVYEIQDNNIICIEWDSRTLKEIPKSIIEVCEKKGYQWDQMCLETSDVKPTTPRDTKKETEETYNELQEKYDWLYLGEEGKRIQSVLSKASSYDYFDACEAWENHLEENLNFPLKAVVAEAQEKNIITFGSEVTIDGIDEIIELYGILVNIRYKNDTYTFPLADLEVIDKNSSDFLPIKDYSMWFANT